MFEAHQFRLNDGPSGPAIARPQSPDSKANGAAGRSGDMPSAPMPPGSIAAPGSRSEPDG